ncbi:RnfH family protein [Oceanimonas sp. CHS3-5]|uniref:RnfH family protein n=1 Tax=Oceanimonas sp. CHS3-5 TaxID=3068186 RepID=UPI00273D82C2|nr:RnfH family protein [Oceanimonas sp. CHS3-5]MDP5290813.1 RnfH family protein [Oceanimonas sp. CHS3-5]
MPLANGPGRFTAVNLIQVEVVYALPEKQTVLSLRAAPDACVREIIEQSGILRQFPDIDLEQNAVGIFSRQVKLDQQVHEGDRIEIYRPLLADPKEIRRRRAEQAKEEGRADKVTGGRPDPKRTRK